MPAWALRQENDQRDDYGRNDRRSQRAAQIQAAVADRLIEEIANGGAERSGQDERDPEEGDTRHACPVIQGRDGDEACDEYQCTAFVAQPAVIGEPISECGAQRARS